ncbi:MAG: B12-binding domain-containing radical SAM protein, partial [Phycisphaerae bacterium]|nr:B12-binding domain-containing radical SAM protein [Phycisphaerae bacterium]
QTHQIPLPRLFDLIYTGLTTALAVPEEIARIALEQDFIQSGCKEKPQFMKVGKDTSRKSRKGKPVE